MGDRPRYRYSDDEMRTIRDRIRKRRNDWIAAVWDPILVDAHGITLAEAGERGMEIDVSAYGIPWDQDDQIGTWATRRFAMAWLDVGPSPVEPGDE